MRLFKFSVIQYEAIINLRIRNLAKLQEKNITAELKTLKDSAIKISSILKSNLKLKKYLKDELSELIKVFGKDRMTLISKAQPSRAIEVKSIVSVEPITALLSKNGWIKFLKGHEQDISKVSFKTGDEYLSHQELYTDKSLMFMDQLGLVYNLDSSKISVTRGSGDPLSKFFQIQDGISLVGMNILDQKISVLSMTDKGYGFTSLYEDMIVKNKKGKTFLKTKDSCAFCSLTVDLDSDTHYLLITSDGYMLIAKLDAIPILPKGRGVKLINIPKTSHETIVFAGVMKKGQSLNFNYESKRNKKMEFHDLKPFIMEKSRRGKKIDKKFLLENVKTTYNIE